MRVTVVGAGIIGTTAAFRIKRRFPDLEITVLAEKFSPNTTSDIGKKTICLIFSLRIIMVEATLEHLNLRIFYLAS